MLSKDVLQNEVGVCEGKVVEVGNDGIWVEKADGQQISILLSGAADNFRVGHSAKIAIVRTVAGTELIKGLNLTTGGVMNAIDGATEHVDTAGVMGFLSAGLMTLLATNVRFTLMLPVPLLNMLAGCFLLMFLWFLALATAKPVRNYLKSLVVGSIACVAWILIAGGLLGTNGVFLMFVAPGVGIFFGFCVVGKALLDQNNLALEEVERRLGLAAA